MRWPQTVMLALALVTLYAVTKEAIRDERKKSHRDVMIKVFGVYLYVILVAYVLHAGGFF